jgi:ParB family chromosome partitioning protein
MPVVGFEHVALANVRRGKCARSRRYDPADITDLAESIAAIGLLEPIIVAPTQKPGQYELVGRQRHFLAAKRLGRPRIMAGILDQPLDEAEARTIAEMEPAPSQVSQEDLIRLQRMTSGKGRTLPL